MKETVKRTHSMVEEMYEKIMDPKRQNQLLFDAQEDEENGQI